MLKALWKKAVYCNQYLSQMNDDTAIRQCDNEIASAREGYRIQAVGNTYGAMVFRVDLTPEESAKIIEEKTQLKAEAAARMEKRRTEYGLKF